MEYQQPTLSNELSALAVVQGSQTKATPPGDGSLCDLFCAGQEIDD